MDDTGKSVAIIERRDGNPDLPVRSCEWIAKLANAIGTTFTTGFSIPTSKVLMKGVRKTKYVRVAFCGDEKDATESAEAFSRIYNDISQWALEYTGIAAKNSYCLGVCRGLQDTAEREAEEEQHSTGGTKRT
ncbi:hypothetical protein TI39_contig4120g00008 [Zymoseptoria brevis]|uniref:DUF7168 domain-containing protein n=1 Tax=Zymoseptoria brevis TaxID=1047168 RepID=A0A0F4GE96_9PEZI|nr:hypothetical protein TI39_contig4120g00008 [Zymoseptoria brevis]